MFNNTHLNDHSKIVKFNYNYPFKLFFGKVETIQAKLIKELL